MSAAGRGPQLTGDGVPTTIGPTQRAAVVEPQLFRGAGVHHPDTVLDHGMVGDLLVRAASVRGTWARYNGTARQDDYAIQLSADGLMAVLAVADGLSSADKSHMGATLAVRTAVQQTVRLLDEGDDEPDLHGVFRSAAYQIQRAAEQMVERGQLAREPAVGTTTSALATTLLVAVIPTTPDRHGQLVLQLARVGDSNAWAVSDEGWTSLMDAKGHPGSVISSSQVTALPGMPDRVEAGTVVLPPDSTLVIATDGVTDPFGDEPTGEVASTLARGLHPQLPPILEFARMIAFRGQSWDDDRTAIAVRVTPGGSDVEVG